MRFIKVSELKYPQLFDRVALLHSPNNPSLSVGDVGTVVEIHPPDAIEVEFLARDGYTRCVATLSVSDVLVLNRERTPVG